MLRSVRAAAIAACAFALFGGVAQAQKPDAKTTAPNQAPARRSATMQVRVTFSGSLLYRLIPSAGVPTVPIPIPAASASAPVAAIPLPANMVVHGTTLELIDSSTGKVARFPVQTRKVITVDDTSFTLVQTVLVPVEVENKGGVTDATVTLTSGPPTYHQQWTLKPADGGVAQFTNVPLTTPVTVKVTNGTDPPFVQTQTLPSNPPPDGYRWPVIYVSWSDVHTVPLQNATPNASGVPTGSNAAPSAAPAAGTSASPINRLFSMVFSIGLLGFLGWGLYTGYQRGHIKKMLENMGVVLPPPESADSTPAVNPFNPRERTPIIPITEGVTDPLAGVTPGAPQAYNGPPAPKLIGKAGAYSGSTYQLSTSTMQIGRDSGCDISLTTDANVSRQHATITSTGATFSIMDNGSSNGTFVNGARLLPNDPKCLAPGDEIHIGNTRFRFEV